MMYTLHFMISVIVSMCPHVEGYSTGAPQNACGSMTPSHNGAAPQMLQSGFPPQYILTTNPQGNYISGQPITVTLQLYTGFQFKGFMIAAKNQTGALINGIFRNASPQASWKTLNCGQGQPGLEAITHTSAQPKSMVQFYWQPTDSTARTVVFHATVVQRFDRFWTHIVSQPITRADPSNQQSQHNFQFQGQNIW